MFFSAAAVTTTATTTSTTTTSISTTTTSTSSTSTTTTLPFCTSSPSGVLAVGNNSVDFYTIHNYANNIDCYSGIYRCPTGYGASVFVDYDTESVHDYFYIYDADSSSWSKWSGNQTRYWWLTPFVANAVKFRFTSDSAVTAWGVSVGVINCYVTTTDRITTTSTTTSTTQANTSSTSSTTQSTTTSTLAGCVYSAGGTLRPGDNDVVFETPHTYTLNMSCYSEVYSCPSDYFARIYARYDTETYYDYFYIYDNASGVHTALTGSSAGYVWLASVNLSSVQFRFTSDDSIVRWGVNVSTIQCYQAITPTTSSTSSSSAITSTTISTTTTITPTSTTTTTSSTTTTLEGPCVMKGNDPPCNEVSFSEVIEAINQWFTSNLGVGKVIDLINSWTDPVAYPPR